MLRNTERRADLSYVFKEYWWVLLCVSLTFSGFLYATSVQQNVAAEIAQKIEQLELRKQQALEEKEFLQQKISSKNDPDFIMMTLIKVLGVTPKGQQKVVFQTEK